MKKINIYLFLGIIYILFIIWNNLRTRLPREVPFKIEPEILLRICQGLPIIMTIILVIEIKNKYFPSLENRFINKIALFLNRPLTTYQKTVEKIRESLVKKMLEYPMIVEKTLSLYNYLIFGNKTLNVEKKIDLDELSASSRVKRLYSIFVIIARGLSFIISSITLIEVYCIGIIKYSYILLPILLIRVILKGYLYVVHECCKLKMNLGSNPAFIVCYNIQMDDIGNIQLKKTNDMEFTPTVLGKQQYSESQLKTKMAEYRFYFYVWNINSHIQKIFEGKSLITSCLKILILFKLF